MIKYNFAIHIYAFEQSNNSSVSISLVCYRGYLHMIYIIKCNQCTMQLIYLFFIPNLIHNSESDKDQTQLYHTENDEEEPIPDLSNMLPFVSQAFDSNIAVGPTCYFANFTQDFMVFNMHLSSHCCCPSCFVSFFYVIPFLLVSVWFISNASFAACARETLSNSLQPVRDGDQWYFVVNIQDDYLDDHRQGRYTYCCRQIPRCW